MAYSLICSIVAMDMIILSTILEAVYCVMCTLSRYQNYLLHAMCTGLVHCLHYLYIGGFISTVLWGRSRLSAHFNAYCPGKSQHEAGLTLTKQRLNKNTRRGNNSQQG